MGQDVPEDDGAGAAAQYGNYTGNKLLNAEIGLWPSPHWAGDLNDFAWTVLHEWGHVLGLADLYSVDHGDGTYELEDFIDHGLPSTDPLNTGGKQDNVMQTIGVMQLDNDEIAGAQWLWGALGVDSLVTGELKALASGSNATKTDDHHGPNTWHYRGTSSVVRSDQASIVTLFAAGVTAARDVGPGDWTKNILADRVIFTSALGYAGNFEFEIDSPLREGYIRATIADNTPTDFSQIPLANGRQSGANGLRSGCGPGTRQPAADRTWDYGAGDGANNLLAVWSGREGHLRMFRVSYRRGRVTQADGWRIGPSAGAAQPSTRTRTAARRSSRGRAPRPIRAGTHAPPRRVGERMASGRCWISVGSLPRPLLGDASKGGKRPGNTI